MTEYDPTSIPFYARMARHKVRLARSGGYARWLRRLKALAAKHDMKWAIDDDKSLADSYRDGMTPREVLQEEYDEARRSS